VLLALDLDDAHPAGAEAGQLRLVAEGRDLDAVVAADLEDRLALEALDHAAVDLDPDPRRRERTLRGLDVEQPLRERLGSAVGWPSGRVSSSVIRRRWPSSRRGTATATAMGWQTPAGQVLWRMCSSSSDRKYRIPLRAGGSPAARGRTAPDATMSAERSSRRVGSVGRGRPSAIRSAISTSRRVPIRHGIVLPHASFAQ
jgi:hypothetical protein